jgi:hypothetical protein
MKTIRRTTATERNPELGAIAIVLAALWMSLFGLAAFAVDIGYAYTNRRGLKAVTTAAVKAGMPAKSSSAATAVLTANGYQNGVGGVTTSVTTSASNLQVDLSVNQPTFFLKLFGINSKTVSARSIGQTTGTGGAAIVSVDSTACGTQWDNSKGIDVTGGGLFMVNGDVESANKIHFGNPSGLCNGTNCRVTGTVRSSCTFWNDPGTSVIGVGATATAAPTTVIPPFTPTCTVGDLSSGLGSVPCNLSAACPTGCLVPPGVYCSNAGITITPSTGPGGICISNASFYSTQPIGITGAGAVTLDNVIVYSNYSGGGPAVQLSNGISYGYTITGSVYAPNGLINAGTGTPGFTMTGTMAGKVVNISMGVNQPWTFNSGGGGSSWKMIE